uniref:BHLH domain-containing protein n=1 Tax=Plectus sambesii TaxID=2011161 RepID=A0A914X9I4_9BILA
MDDDYRPTYVSAYSLNYGYVPITPTHPHSIHLPPPPLGGIQLINLQATGTVPLQQREAPGHCDNKDVDDENDGSGRVLNPFSPEANVPLPFQLTDEFGYFGPSSVWKRNERERHRVRCVNDGYEKLRSHLPLGEKDKRISKVDTLRIAIRYIRHLERLLADERHWRDCRCYEESLSGDEIESSTTAFRQ